jgi:hypothetical protein
MNARRAGLAVLLVAATLTVARGGHELPVYPSYYPHEIEIATVAPERAAALLTEGKLHAYLGGAPRFAATPPDNLRAVETLGSFVLVRVNPATDERAACTVTRTAVQALATSREMMFHPYPVVPLHGDYLNHVDLAEAARARFAAGADLPVLKLKAGSERARRLIPERWAASSDADWDAEIVDVDAAQLAEQHAVAFNGWLEPPWLRAGWYQAALLLGGPEDAERVAQLQETADGNGVERINRERELVRTLAARCRVAVAGYTLKREYYNAEFSAGIENIGYDAIEGLASPIFLRTVKLKDFPWNGWLALGVADAPGAAWNPIAGFSDRFGRLMWFAVGDPSLIPSPYDSAWMLNRTSEIRAAR